MYLEVRETKPLVPFRQSPPLFTCVSGHPQQWLNLVVEVSIVLLKSFWCENHRYESPIYSWKQLGKDAHPSISPLEFPCVHSIHPGNPLLNHFLDMITFSCVQGVIEAKNLNSIIQRMCPYWKIGSIWLWCLDVRGVNLFLFSRWCLNYNSS